jgi:hypothetical protein
MTPLIFSLNFTHRSGKWYETQFACAAMDKMRVDAARRVSLNELDPMTLVVEPVERSQPARLHGYFRGEVTFYR